MFCSTMGIASMRSWYSAAASISSCFLKWAMSSGCVRSSSLVSVADRSCQYASVRKRTEGVRKELPTFVVEFFKVMDLILILVVTVMTRSRLCTPKSSQLIVPRSFIKVFQTKPLQTSQDPSMIPRLTLRGYEPMSPMMKVIPSS